MSNLTALIFFGAIASAVYWIYKYEKSIVSNKKSIDDSVINDNYLFVIEALLRAKLIKPKFVSKLSYAPSVIKLEGANEFYINKGFCTYICPNGATVKPNTDNGIIVINTNMKVLKFDKYVSKYFSEIDVPSIKYLYSKGILDNHIPEIVAKVINNINVLVEEKLKEMPYYYPEHKEKYFKEFKNRHRLGFILDKHPEYLI